MTFFSDSQLGLLRSLRSNDLRWWNFEAATSKFCNHSWNFGSSTQKGKVDLCMTNGSKVMVYLTLLNLLLHYLQEYSKIWNIAKSNKSELWNCLSYRGLPYLFEVRSKTFRNDCKNQVYWTWFFKLGILKCDYRSTGGVAAWHLKTCKSICLEKHLGLVRVNPC